MSNEYGRPVEVTGTEKSDVINQRNVVIFETNLKNQEGPFLESVFYAASRGIYEHGEMAYYTIRELDELMLLLKEEGDVHVDDFELYDDEMILFKAKLKAYATDAYKNMKDLFIFSKTEDESTLEAVGRAYQHMVSFNELGRREKNFMVYPTFNNDDFNYGEDSILVKVIDDSRDDVYKTKIPASVDDFSQDGVTDEIQAWVKDNAEVIRDIAIKNWDVTSVIWMDDPLDFSFSKEDKTVFMEKHADALASAVIER